MKNGCVCINNKGKETMDLRESNSEEREKENPFMCVLAYFYFSFLL